MGATENFSRLLPGYLTDETRKNLEVALKSFTQTSGIFEDPFISFKNDYFLQGDIVKDIPFPFIFAKNTIFQSIFEKIIFGHVV